jgi:hypothetical protein
VGEPLEVGSAGDHGDHFDEVAAAELDKDVPILTSEHAARKLKRQGFTRPIPLETWESRWVHRPGARLRVASMPGKDAPQPLQPLLLPAMGSMLDFFHW